MCGADLDDWLSGERDWTEFWDLKDLLPLGSHYTSALYDDDEIADLLAEKMSDTPTRESLRGFNREMYLLTRGFNALLGPLAALAGAQPADVGFLKGPQSAIDRAKKRRREVQRSKTLAKVLPHQFGS